MVEFNSTRHTFLQLKSNFSPPTLILLLLFLTQRPTFPTFIAAVQHERAPRNCGPTHNLLHPNAFSSELYPISEIAMPPPNLFLPFAPLPSFCFANYADMGRFSSGYAPPSLWDPLNLTSSYIPTLPNMDHTPINVPKISVTRVDPVIGISRASSVGKIMILSRVSIRF